MFTVVLSHENKLYPYAQITMSKFLLLLSLLFGISGATENQNNKSSSLSPPWILPETDTQATDLQGLFRRKYEGYEDYNHTICEYLSQEQCRNATVFTSIQFMSQRDVQFNLTIFDSTYTGFNLNKGLFNSGGYVGSSVELIPQILSLGFTYLHMSLYWNERLLQWQLCPFDTQDAISKAATDPNYILTSSNITANNITCSMSSDLLGFESVMDMFRRFIKSTGNELTTSLIQLGLDLHSLNNSQTSSTNGLRRSAPGSQCLSTIINNYIKDQLYTPKNLLADRDYNYAYGPNGLFLDQITGFPKVYRFLLQDDKNLMVRYANVSLLDPIYSSYPKRFVSRDETYLFNMTYSSSSIDSKATSKYKIFHNSYQRLNIISTNDLPAPNCSSMSAAQFKNQLLDHSGDISSSVQNQLALRNASFNIAVEDTKENPFTNLSLQKYIECGFIPILSTPVEEIGSLIKMANAAVWSWKPDQPSIPAYVPDGGEGDNGAGLGAHGTYTNILNESKNNKKSGSYDMMASTNMKSAWRCALLDIDGWRTANCFESHPVLCAPRSVVPNITESVHSSSSQRQLYTWSFGSNSTYFMAPHACPYSDHVFTAPRTSLQDTSARLTLEGNSSIQYPVWIDLNSIDVKDCWISGGPLARCPYTPANWTRSRVAVLSVVAAVIFIFIILMYFVTLDKVPIRHSEGKFKKIIAKFNENQYQGVPS